MGACVVCVRFVDSELIVFAQLVRIDRWVLASTERLTEHPVREQSIPRTLQHFH